jgi:hypothetical protein
MAGPAERIGARGTGIYLGETMGGTDAGTFRRMLRKLTSDVETLDADEMSQDAQRSGAQRADECACGQEVTMQGRLRSVEFCPQEADATLEAELFDGTEGVTLIWLGRRRIPGIEPGRTMRVRGRLAIRDGRKVLYNPYYEICQAQPS